jgi:hypothetical protein
MEISLGAQRSDRSFCVRLSLRPCCGNYPCRQPYARGSGIFAAPRFPTFSTISVDSGCLTGESAGTKDKICITRFLLIGSRRGGSPLASSRRIAARVVSAWLGPARRGLARVGEARGGSARLRSGRERRHGSGRGSHNYFTKCFLPTQTNFDKVKVEILAPTESGISPLRRALDAAFRLSSISAAAQQHVHNQ